MTSVTCTLAVHVSNNLCDTVYAQSCLCAMCSTGYSTTTTKLEVLNFCAINKARFYDENHLSFFTLDRNGANLSSTSVMGSGSKSFMLKENSMLSQSERHQKQTKCVTHVTTRNHFSCWEGCKDSVYILQPGCTNFAAHSDNCRPVTSAWLLYSFPKSLLDQLLNNIPGSWRCFEDLIGPFWRFKFRITALFWAKTNIFSNQDCCHCGLLTCTAVE